MSNHLLFDHIDSYLDYCTISTSRTAVTGHHTDHNCCIDRIISNHFNSTTIIGLYCHSFDCNSNCCHFGNRNLFEFYTKDYLL